jgi:mannose/fructose/N-acetylgalactosamine-specific phosphotransferase system component IID
MSADMEGQKVTLSRSDVRRSFWLWTFFSHANYNYERLQGTAFAQAMVPILKKLYKDPEELKAGLKRHLVFFNTEPNVGGMIHGAVIAMEEQRANGAPIDDDAINSLKSGLMGPLAGIGDSITQGTITPILLSIGIGLTLGGSIIGPIFYLVAEVAIMVALAYFFWMQGYDRGKTGVMDLLRSGTLDRFLTGASVLGNMVMGALAYQFVKIWLVIAFNVDVGGGQNKSFDATRDLLNPILPGLLPLGFVVMTWYLLTKRRVSAIRLLVIYLIIAFIGALPIWQWLNLGLGYGCESLLNAFYQPDCFPAPPAS